MIGVQRVCKYFGAHQALKPVSFTVPSQGALVVFGPSGCGKTTLLRLIAGLELPDEGEIRLHDALASRPGWALPPHRRNLGFMFQGAALWPHLTVAQNIGFGLSRLPRDEAHRRLVELLERTGLTRLAGRYPQQLSGGEARRVALARTLAPRPACLLLDEPLTNLDTALKSDLLLLIQETVQQTGATLVYVTHEEDEAGRISAQRLCFTTNGGWFLRDAVGENR